MKTLLVVGAGTESIVSLQRAKRMGLRLVVSDGNPDAPGFVLADYKVIASTYNPLETVSAFQDALLHLHVEPDGVIALVADVPMTVSEVAWAFGLPGFPRRVAELGADKFKMKQALQALGIATPAGALVFTVDELKDLVKYHRRAGVQTVLKPLDSRGARGVVRLLKDVGLEWAFNQAKAQSPTGRVMLEEWIDGPQFSTETVICTDGSYVTPGFLDRNYDRLGEFAPFVVEDGATAPTLAKPEEKAAIIKLVERAALGLVGLREKLHPCTIKGDLVLGPDGPMVIELALRLSGGYMSSQAVPFNTGVDLVGVAIKLALGETVTREEVTPASDRPVAIRYNIPVGCRNHTERKGHAVAVGSTRENAILNAQMKLHDYAANV